MYEMLIVVRVVAEVGLVPRILEVDSPGWVLVPEVVVDRFLEMYGRYLVAAVAALWTCRAQVTARCTWS